MELYRCDCFEFFKDNEDRLKYKVDLVVVDLPYGQTEYKWDKKIDLKKMWKHLFKITKPDAVFCFFTTTKYGYELIHSKPHLFCYDLVWYKTNSVGFLSAKKGPLRKHEMIYIFKRNNINDVNVEFNKTLREYSKNLFEWIGKTKQEIFKEMGNRGLDHFTRWDTLQFSLPTKKNYKLMEERYNIEEYKDYMTYEEMRGAYQPIGCHHTYNPQMTEGKPYKTKNGVLKDSPYGDILIIGKDNKGERYPVSVLKYGYDKEKLHGTQKPVALCEWLVKTYSNKGDKVLDFTMGSGSTGVACKNTGRYFIGVEIDEDIYKVAEKRLND